LGSNIEPQKNIQAAVAMLAAQSRLIAVSSVWETRPIGLPNQPNFLNLSAIIQTELTAEKLKHQTLTNIENKLGRTRRGNKFGPRTIDIDIMLFNNNILKAGKQSIPNDEVLERPFVAITLAEIAPDYIHPVTGQSLKEIAQNFMISPNEMNPCPKISTALLRFVKQ
jgi:2-amino-4-hydroxy-6-hydroxymethyldihydropteridine diphosphokinase